MKLQIDVVHPTETTDMPPRPVSLQRWQLSVKPHDLGDDAYQPVGPANTPDSTSRIADNVPEGNYDFRIVWTDTLGQDSDPAVVNFDATPQQTPDLKPKPGSFTVTRIDQP